MLNHIQKNKLYFHSEHIDQHLNLLNKFLNSPVSLRWGSLADWRILSSKKILVDLQSTSYETGNFCQQVLWTKNRGCWNPRKSESSNSVCLIVKKKNKNENSLTIFLFFYNPNHLFHEMSTLFWRDWLFRINRTCWTFLEWVHFLWLILHLDIMLYTKNTWIWMSFKIRDVFALLQDECETAFH